MTIADLLASRPRVINVGLEVFARDLTAQGLNCVHMEWSPPACADPELLDCLSVLDGAGAEPGSPGARVEDANRQALRRLFAGDPALTDVLPAGEAIPALKEGRVLLHAGPPIEWERMCGPLRGAIAGAAVLEGWAPDLEAAEALAAGGGIAFHPNHHFDAVGPMTGITTASMAVMTVENRRFGNRAFCTLNEGLGKVMRFGGNDAEVLKRLKWLADVARPALSAALRDSGGVDLKPLVARGLAMGDEMHQRNVACSSLLIRELAPILARTGGDSGRVAELLAFMGGNDQFFLNVAMAMGKALTDPLGGIADSTMVTAMSRNGTDFGIRVAATGDTWFTAPVEMPEGMYFPGFSAEDANPDMGDSTIVETVGLGGFAMAAAPAVAGFVGAGSAFEALAHTRRMMEITTGQNPDWTIPALDFTGVPAGIDVRKVVASGIAPTINTGIAHRKPGIGQVGAGVVRAPLACFEQALAAICLGLGLK